MSGEKDGMETLIETPETDEQEELEKEFGELFERTFRLERELELLKK